MFFYWYRTLIRLAMLWNLCLLMFPLIIFQALWARLRTPRLPEAQGDPELITGAERIILGIGESTVAGVGVERMEQALTASAAAALTAKLDETVDWMSCGRNGARLKDVLADFHQLPVKKFDSIVIALGVNDVTGLTSLLGWSRQILELISKLKANYAVPLFFCAVPPMQFFTALPQPLRYVLGVRARLLNHLLEQTAQAMPDVHFVGLDLLNEQVFLAEDGYHPSAEGYYHLGAQLADSLYPIMVKKRSSEKR